MFEEIRFPVLGPELIRIFKKEKEENQVILDHKRKKEDLSPQNKTRT
jgi:hypothetical protein